MINNIKTAIVNKLIELYPKYTIYDEDVSQNFKKPSFLIILINQEYSKRLNTKCKSTVSFDIAYFTNKSKAETKEDCINTQIKLLREFDLIGNYRVLNKQTTITDNVLHFTFDINYSEIKTKQKTYMQTKQTNI